MTEEDFGAFDCSFQCPVLALFVGACVVVLALGVVVVRRVRGRA